MRKKKRVLTSDMHSLGKALARGTLKSVSQAAFQCPSSKTHVEELVGKEVSKECKNLCSLSKPSILRSMSKDAAVKFSWAAVSEELNSRAPYTTFIMADRSGGVGTNHIRARQVRPLYLSPRVVVWKNMQMPSKFIWLVELF